MKSDTVKRILMGLTLVFSAAAPALGEAVVKPSKPPIIVPGPIVNDPCADC